ncbi:MAG: UDP-N-acetylmuramoyl-L-alanyl-D-glutamate--2,6-diaminopimelate ligase [Saprospiraceae bacterium]
MKNLVEILSEISEYRVIGERNKEFDSIVLDSRFIVEDSAFCAVKGIQSDGFDYIESAITKGAKVIFCEKEPLLVVDGITYIVVDELKSNLTLISNVFYDYPSSKLKLVGVTGTNGKTTIATLLYRLATDLGFKSGLLSTVENKIGENTIASTHTTPDVFSLNGLLKNMVDEGCEYVFMEVSSHALDQDRVKGLDFDGALFTNITHDHLDYHKTFKNYIETKKKFFDNLKIDSFALTNIDDKNGKVMVQNTKADVKSYSLNSISDFKGKILDISILGLDMLVNGTEVHFKLTGKFNAYNLLAIYGAAILLGWNKEEVLRFMSDLNPAQGRFHLMRNSKSGVNVIVDYAHTPDALKNILETIRDFKKASQNIITIFGAGGDRDKTKRPEMGAIASNYSDIVIVTSDNPRTENPETIIQEILEGISKSSESKILSISDRKEAIKTGLMLAQNDDIVNYSWQRS